MQKYVIYAYEQSYGGLHGMYDWIFVYCNDDEEAEKEAEQASYEVMGSYNCITEYLEDSARERSDDEDDYEDCLDGCYQENIAYEYWKVKEECPYSDEEINEKLFIDPEYFVQRWCENGQTFH